MEWLQSQIRREQVDVLLIAGDIFDSPNPSAQAQRMYYRFLKEVTSENPNLQIIIIAGNHDSAARLEAPNPLLEQMNITVRGVIKRTAAGEIDLHHLIVPLDKGGYCLAVPYLRQGDYPNAETYAQGVQKMYRELYDATKELGGPVIAMGHLQATGSEISENDRSERSVIGGLECVAPESFSPEIVYTALGHLHRAQRVSGRENVRYAGAPLPMSFAERNNKQGITLVEIPDAQNVQISNTVHAGASETIADRTALPRIVRIEFETPVKLLSIPAKAEPLQSVLDEIARLPNGEMDETSPYLELKVLITGPEPSLRHQIEQALCSKSVRLARIAAVTPKKETGGETITYEELQNINPMDMALDIFKHKYGGEQMPDKMQKLLQGVIRDIDL